MRQRAIAPAPRYSACHADGGLHGKAAYPRRPTTRMPRRGWSRSRTRTSRESPPIRSPTIQGVLALFDGRCGRLLALDGLERGHRDSDRRGDRRRGATPCALDAARSRSSAVACKPCPIRAVTSVRRFGASSRSTRSRRGRSPRDAHQRPTSNRRDGPCRPFAAHRTRPDIIITCTSRRPRFLGTRDVLPGAFVAAVGADNEDKSEIEPELMRSADVIVDSLAQTSTIGDLHHAIAAGVMATDDVRGELGALWPRRRPMPTIPAGS